MTNQNVNRKILVVDDEPMNVRLMELNLKSEGYTIITADNGEEALQKFKSEKPDLILLDIMMPIMDGNEVCRHIRSDFKDRWTPIIMATALGDRKVQSLDDGADDFIVKPIDRYELLARVRSLLRVKELQDELIKANKHLNEELSLAKEVQQALLPQELPNIPNLEFSHRYIPSLIIGGDFFDILEISPSLFAIFLCDVMGHGPQAAMITGIVKAFFIQLARYYPDPDDLLFQMNNRFYNLMSESNLQIFITAFCLVVNAQNGSVTYANAGHPSPFVIRNLTSRFEEMTVERGYALGLIPDTLYQTQKLNLDNGDMIFLFTDGLIEIKDGNKTLFGEKEFLNTIQNDMHLSPEGFIVAILESAGRFSNLAFTEDDITLLTFRYNQVGAD
jgi:sigma-B regulation protein RsbU (phosphoserine phosphatase)